MHLRYEDFRLDVFGEATTGYTVVAHGPGAIDQDAPFVLQVDPAMQMVLSHLEEGLAPTPNQMQQLGELLYQALFPPLIHLAYEQAHQAIPSGSHVRLKLHLRPPELARLPWEFLYDGAHFLTARLTDPLVRFIQSGKPVASLRAEPPLRVLYLQASPRGQNHLRLEESERALLVATQGWAEVKVVRAATPGKLLEVLRQPTPYHILHFDGHGSFDAQTQQGYLLFEDDDGNTQPLAGDLLATYLAGSKVRLVVLAACESGTDSPEQRFLGVAQRLMHGTDLPAVVAMQFGIDDQAAIAFNRGFYQALAAGYPVEGALSEGRKEVLEQTGGYEKGSFASLDWAAPALFMRATDGHLFPSLEEVQPQQAARRLVEGVAKLPTDYSMRIRNFLTEYLGTAEQPVPFGGRMAELAALDAWLADENAPPYALIAAEAGRGKSALLVRWAQRLLGQGEVHVVFVPVSIRFNTALATVTFTSLAAQLGEVYEEPVQWANLSVEQWRGVVQSFLGRTPPNGKQVVVILDGLDEAADWRAGSDLFPLDPVLRVRVIVSARYLVGDTGVQGWLRRLGWERMGRVHSLVLPLLTQAGLREVLRAMGNPLDSLGTKVNVIGELHRLSEGDPLLVRLYVEELVSHSRQTGPITPEALREIRPGLRGYFDKWWEDQRKVWGKASPLKERMVESVFSLLSCALGPVKRDELLELAPPEIALSSWTLKEALEPLERFIVGEGEQQGYIFSHPRLGYHFRDELSLRERAFWEERFLVFGKRVLEDLNRGVLPPQEAPPYMVRYYGAHLDRAQAPADSFFALVSEGWMRAWEALEGTYAGFLEDAGRAWQRAEEGFRVSGKHQGMDQGECLVVQVKCALCQASLAALSVSISKELLIPATAKGVLPAISALVIAQQLPDERQQANALVALAPHLMPNLLPRLLDTVCAFREERLCADTLSALSPDLPHTLLGEVLAAAWHMVSEPERTKVLVALAAHPLPDLLEEVLAAARAVQDEPERTKVLVALAAHPLPDLLEEVLAAARAIEGEWLRAEILSALAAHPLRDLLEEVLAAARAVQDEEGRAKVLSALVSHFPAEGQAGVLEEALAALRDMEQTWETEETRAYALIALAPSLSRALLEEVLAAACAIRVEKERAKVLAVLAAQPLPDLLEEVLAAACAVQDEKERAKVLAVLAAHPLPDLLEEVLAAACAIRVKEIQTKVLIALAAHPLPDLLKEVLTAARDMYDEKQAKILTKTLSTMTLYPLMEGQAGSLEEVLAAARDMENHRCRAKVLSALIPHLPAEEQVAILQEVVDVVRALWDDGKWEKVPSALTAYLPIGEQIRMLQKALAEASVIGDENGCLEVLVSLAPYLPYHLLEEVLAMVRAIRGDKEKYVRMLSMLVPHLPAKEGVTLLQEALEVARGITSRFSRARTLGAIAPQLSGAEKAETLEEVLAAVQGRTRGEIWGMGTERYTYEHLDILDWFATGDDYTETLSILASHSLPDLLWQVLAAARDMRKEERRVEMLVALASHSLPDLLWQVLAAARDIESKEAQAKVLVALASHSLPDLLWQVLAAARDIESKEAQAKVLVALASHVPAENRYGMLSEALAIVRTIPYEIQRAEVLAALVPLLPFEEQSVVLREALALIRPLRSTSGDDDYSVIVPVQVGIMFWGRDERTKVLLALVPHLPFDLLGEALAAARDLWDAQGRVEVLSALAPRLPAEEQARALQEALVAAQEIKPEPWWIYWNKFGEGGERRVALNTLAPSLVGWAQSSPLEAHAMWAKTLHTLAAHPRPAFLTDLVSLLPFVLGLVSNETNKAAVGIFQVVKEVSQWWP